MDLWGAGYPVVRQNPHSSRNTSGVKEGDTPSWFYFLPTGLGDPEHPDWGGWGGRFENDNNNHYVDGIDRHWYAEANEGTMRKWTVARWREAYQNDFAARMDWCADPFDRANHPPLIILNGDASLEPVHLTVDAGSSLVLTASSVDPDNDAVDLDWWIYHEVTGISAEDAELQVSPGGKCTFTPKEAIRGRTIHLIVEGKDNGDPRLIRYRRAIISVN